MRILSAALLLSWIPVIAATDTRISTLVVNVSPACSISIVSSTFTVDTANDVSGGQISFRYFVRTSRAGGSGSIKFLPDDFSRTITFSSQLSGTGMAASGAQTAAGLGGTVVATFAADAHSADGGDSGTISWTAPGISAPQWSLTIDCQ